jgi:hypothetical protein
VSHLEFADDTLLLGVKSWANVKVMCAMLVLFELMSGLKVNFHKSICWLGLIYQIIGYTRPRLLCIARWGKFIFSILASLLVVPRGVWVFGNRYYRALGIDCLGGRVVFLSVGGRLVLI